MTNGYGRELGPWSFLGFCTIHTIRVRVSDSVYVVWKRPGAMLG